MRHLTALYFIKVYFRAENIQELDVTDKPQNTFVQYTLMCYSQVMVHHVQWS